MSDDLTAFVRAQFDEDERRAPEVHGASCPAVDSSGMLYAVDPDLCTCGWPKRLMEDVAVKRAILDLHAPIEGPYVDFDPACDTCGESVEYPVLWPCATIKLIIQSCAGREDGGTSG